jgi:hypothetical protein
MPPIYARSAPKVELLQFDGTNFEEVDAWVTFDYYHNTSSLTDKGSFIRVNEWPPSQSPYSYTDVQAGGYFAPNGASMSEEAFNKQFFLVDG